MNQRPSIFGNGQDLDGDLTSTGATCIASQSRGTFNGRRWLIEGEQRWIQDGRPTAVNWGIDFRELSR